MNLDFDVIMNDLNAVVNSITVDKLDVLLKVQEIINTRVEELSSESEGKQDGKTVSKDGSEKDGHTTDKN